MKPQGKQWRSKGRPATKASKADCDRARRTDCCAAMPPTPARPEGAAAGASVESAVLRRSRHANRRRWYVVLHGDADRPAGAGAAVLDHPQARGRQALSRDPGGEGRHPRRRCAVPGGRDAEGGATTAAGCCASAPMSTTGWRAMPGTGLRFEMAADGGLTPYLHVRADLWAKVTRALYYDLVDMGEERVVDGQHDVRGRIRRRVLRDGGCGAGEGRALNEPMLKKMRPAAISAAEFFDRSRARLSFDVPPGLVDPNIIPQTGDRRQRPHAGDRRARAAGAAGGGADPGGRSSASRPCC